MDLDFINQNAEIGLKIFYLSWILIILLFYFKKKEKIKKIVIIGIFLFFLLFLLKSSFQSIWQYYIWNKDPMAKFWLPSYNNWYIFYYCYNHFFRSTALAIGGAFLIGILFWIFVKKNRITSSELWLAVLATLFSGWPNLIIFLGLIFLLAIFFSLIQNYIRRNKKRIFLFFPIIIACLITILFGNFIAEYLGISVLKM